MEKLKRPQQESNMSVHYSSKTDEWATPQDFFVQLDREFHFTLDPCANEQNHKCDKFYTREQNGLSKNWGGKRGVLQPSLWQRYWEVGQILI